MGLQLPGELVWLLGELGFNWPEADEEKLIDVAMTWIDFGAALEQAVTAGDAAAQQVWAANLGADITAFQQAWADGSAPSANLATMAQSCLIVGAGMLCAALIVLVLKINVIVQLVTLAIAIAQAIATAAVTFGASLAEIPIFKMIIGAIVDEIINQAIETVLNG
ncbi:WXG100-like domain-containing protein [Actinoplanes subglobosus]|uniref:Outer membrane channel protein CpnT-like N-terminal domain-containing protein n=1 Tax=Actinoplanes subglobosus TaxID=1547892 RepID=A0ABV8J0A1_9ACTN